MNTYVYELDGNLYINLTNYCSNSCDFCVRNGKDSYFGNNLWLDKEPTAKDVLDIIKEKRNFKEVVFCGFGEPTKKIDILLEIAKELKSQGFYLRINTNGQGNLINNRDITSDLASVIDYVNVSLNESNAKSYQELCHSVFGEASFEELLSFAESCQEKGIRTVLSIVDSIGEKNVNECKKIAKARNLELKVRKFIENS